MNILIAYAGKSGTTAKCAHLLAEQIKEATVVDLCKTTPDPAGFDAVVVGGSIRMGKLHKCVLQYLNQYEAILSKKRSAYFICCGFPENQKEVFAANIPDALLSSAVTVQCFGGEMDLDSLRGMDKFIAKMVTKATADKNLAPPAIQYDRIQELAAKIQE